MSRLSPTMDSQEEIKRLKESLKQAEKVQAELDLRVFNLKTLYDVSKDIYGSVESETIIRNFLLMTMGNFGVVEGFILLLDEPSKETNQFVSIRVSRQRPGLAGKRRQPAAGQRGPEGVTARVRHLFSSPISTCGD